MISQSIYMEVLSGETEELIGLGRLTNAQTSQRRLQDTSSPDMIEWQIDSLDKDGFEIDFTFTHQNEETLLATQNTVMKLTFEQGEDYLINAIDGISMAKNQYFVARIVIPKQIPRSDTGDYVYRFVEHLGEAL